MWLRVRFDRSRSLTFAQNESSYMIFYEWLITLCDCISRTVAETIKVVPPHPGWISRHISWLNLRGYEVDVLLVRENRIMSLASVIHSHHRRQTDDFTTIADKLCNSVAGEFSLRKSLDVSTSEQSRQWVTGIDPWPSDPCRKWPMTHCAWPMTHQ